MINDYLMCLAVLQMMAMKLLMNRMVSFYALFLSAFGFGFFFGWVRYM